MKMRGLNFGNKRYKVIDDRTFKPFICCDKRITIPAEILRNFPLKDYDKSICIVKIKNNTEENIRIKKINKRCLNNYSISFKKEKNMKNSRVEIINIISEEEALKRKQKMNSSKVPILSIIPKTTGLTPIYTYQLDKLKTIIGGYYKNDIIFKNEIEMNERTSSVVGLYFAEGGKTYTSFSNSYPQAINLILDFIEDISNIKKNHIKASIGCNPKLKEKESNLKEFWAYHTGIENFTKIHICKNSKSPCGTLDFKFGGEIFRHIFLEIFKMILKQQIKFDSEGLVKGIFSGDGSPIQQNRTCLTHNISLSKKNKEFDFKIVEKSTKDLNLKPKKYFYKGITKAMIYSSWIENLELVFMDIYKFNPLNRLVFAKRFFNLPQTKTFLAIKNGDIIKGHDIFKGSKRTIQSLKNYELIELKRIIPKPNTIYEISFTEHGNKIMKKIKSFRKNEFKNIKNNFLDFCKSLKNFDLFEEDWYGLKGLR